MEYIVKDTAVNAERVQTPSDAFRVYQKCSLFVAIMVSKEKSTGEEEYLFELENEPIFAYPGDWVVWNDKKAWVVSNKKFTKKYARRDNASIVYGQSVGAVTPHNLTIGPNTNF